jgi:hypothetical protein
MKGPLPRTASSNMSAIRNPISSPALGRLIARVPVGVVFERLFSVRFFYRLVVRIACNAEDFVVILF